VEEKNCVVAIYSGAAEGEIELGTYFLTSFYTSLDFEKLQVGLAVNKKVTWGATTGPAADLLPSTSFNVTMDN